MWGVMTGIVLTALAVGGPALADVGLSIGPESADRWQAQRSWQSNPSDGASVTVGDGALDFSVPEPERGMKWRIPFEPVDTYVYRWLVVRYRMRNYDPAGAGDYLIWCDADTDEDGLRLLPPYDPPYDEAPHVVAFDLQERAQADEISAIAVQCRSGEAGDAHLIIESIELADRPPDGAEGDAISVAELRTVEPDILRAELWQHEPSWLSNPTENFDVQSTDDGLRLEVGEAGWGMKWSAALAEPIEGMKWLSVRCRAENIDPRPGDYFVYIASRGGGKAPEEQYCINLGDLRADGEWHVVSAPVTVPSINTVALQVQARGGPAHAEIDWLRFSTQPPELTLADILSYGAAEALAPSEKALGIDGPTAPSADAQAAIGATTWFSRRIVSVRGVTFDLGEDLDTVAATPYAEHGEIKLAACPKASEIHLLIAARFARKEEPAYGGGLLRRVVYPHRFSVAVTYGDGVVDEFIPSRIPREGPARQFEVGAGIDAYVIGPLRDAAIREIVLRDGMRRGRFFLAAATANTGEARFCTERPEERPYTVATPRQGRVELEAVGVVGPGEVGLRLAARGLAELSVPGPVFSLKVNGEAADLAQLEDVRRSQAPGVNVAGVAQVGEARVTCKLAAEDDPELEGVRLRLTLVNAGDEIVEIQPTFPDLPPMKADAKWGESWYFFPRRGAVINHVPIGLREAYSGAFPFQVESVFWPDAGMGLYVMTRDLDLTFRYWRLFKDDDGVRVSIEYPKVTLQPGESWTSVDTVVGVNKGDWHGAWQAYRDWLATWYQPAAPRKDWFRKVFNFRQHFLHFELPEKSGMFDDDSKQFDMRPVIERDIEAFGGVDYLHVFDWGWSEKYGRCGDYDHWEQLGGADNFAKAIAGVHDMGIPTGLYIEGYLVDPPSNYGKAHGEEYQLLDAEGKPYPYFAPSYNMCSAVNEWQDYLAGVYKRTREATGARGFYVDQMGFADPHHICYAKHHGHPVPWPPAPGQRDLISKIRDALGPDAAIYTEESPPDVTSRLQDGSFTYNHASVSDEWSPTHLNLYRFTIPSFKTFEIIVCDKPTGSHVQAVKRVFFSGEGLWIEGIWDKWFTPETRATIQKTHAILKRYADAFASDNPTPLVPTLMGNVYANEFPAGDGRQLCVWTLYNANPRTVRGPALRVPHVEGAKYVDAWNEKALEAEIDGEEAVIGLEIGPKDVGCVARSVR